MISLGRVLPLLLVLPFCGFMQDEWMVFSPDKKFSVELPGEPMLKPENPGVKKKGVEGKTWSSRTTAQIYMISYIELPEAIPPDRKDFRDQVFKNVHQGLLRNDQVELTVTSDKSLTIGTFPAREFEAKGARKADGATASMRGRTIISRDRVYVMWVMRAGDQLDDSSADRFFNSLKILKS